MTIIDEFITCFDACTSLMQCLKKVIMVLWQLQNYYHGFFTDIWTPMTRGICVCITICMLFFWYNIFEYMPVSFCIMLVQGWYYLCFFFSNVNICMILSPWDTMHMCILIHSMTWTVNTQSINHVLGEIVTELFLSVIVTKISPTTGNSPWQALLIFLFFWDWIKTTL